MDAHVLFRRLRENAHVVDALTRGVSDERARLQEIRRFFHVDAIGGETD